jgi:hypothetical protein
MAAFQESKFGRIALSIAVMEPLIIWGGVLVLYLLHSAASPWLAHGLRLVYAIGVLSLILATIGLQRDRQGRSAALALVLSILNQVLCVIPILR